MNPRRAERRQLIKNRRLSGEWVNARRLTSGSASSWGRKYCAFLHNIWPGAPHPPATQCGRKKILKETSNNVERPARCRRHLHSVCLLVCYITLLIECLHNKGLCMTIFCKEGRGPAICVSDKNVSPVPNASTQGEPTPSAWRED